MTNTKGTRFWKRWVDIGPIGLLELANIARRHGLRVVSACKPGWFTQNHLLLWGTRAQMDAAVNAWTVTDGAGRIQHTHTRKPADALPIAIRDSRSTWVDAEPVGMKT